MLLPVSATILNYPKGKESALATWHYERGQWTESTFPDDEWRDGEEFDAMLKRLGYERHFGISREFGFGVILYNRIEPPEFIVNVTDAYLYEIMTTATLPDALDLLARYAPIVTATEVAGAIDEINSFESYGIISMAIASAQVNGTVIDELVNHERQKRRERAQQYRLRREENARRARAAGHAKRDEID